MAKDFFHILKPIGNGVWASSFFKCEPPVNLVYRGLFVSGRSSESKVRAKRQPAAKATAPGARVPQAELFIILYFILS